MTTTPTLETTPNRSLQCAQRHGEPRPRLPYMPALDGLRGVAVAAVLCFHAGFSWAKGGYLGVSTFFTLSGFLITSLLLAEHEQSGQMRLGRFWERRFRRLMPAALVTLALAVLYGATVAEPSQVRELRGDVLAALAYVANWRFVLAEESYAELFTAPSPVLHFWSLAIEEQYYLIFPLLAMGLATRTHRPRRMLAVAFAAIALTSVLLPLVTAWSQDRVYYGTDTRAAELLAGAFLATVYGTRRLTRPSRAAVVLAGTAASGALLWLYSSVAQWSPWLYQGGFALVGVASAAVVAAAVQPAGLVPSALSFRPLVALGRISYGVYLYHWLVYQWLTPARTGLSGGALFALRVTLTLALASASFHLLEQPVREGRLLAGRRALVAAPVAAAAITVALGVVTASPPRPPIDFEAAQQALAAVPEAPPPGTAEPGSVEVGGVSLPEPPPPRVAVFGDSTALMTAVGISNWAGSSEQAVQVPGNSWLGCGVVREGTRRTLPGEESPAPDGCENWAETWAEATRLGEPDLAVVQVGPWEVTDHLLPGDDTWRAPGDPVYDELLRTEVLAATDVLSARGAEVVWLTSPPVGPGTSGEEIARRGEAADPGRMQRLNEIIVDAASERPGVAHVVDLASYVQSTGDDVRLRPDGVHFSPESATEVAAGWLGPQLVALHRSEWIDEHVQDEGVPLPEPVRVMVVGDSTAMLLGFGLNDRAHDVGDTQVASLAELGCGIARGGTRDYHGVVTEVPQACEEVWGSWEEALDTYRPHVVVALTGPFEVADRRLPGDSTWRAPGDPAYDRFLRSELEAATALLTSRSSLLVWLTSPRIEVGRADVSPPAEPYPASDPDRMARLNAIISDVVERTDRTALADLAGHLASSPGGEIDPRMRPDGVHLSNEAARDVAGWLGPLLIDLYRQQIVVDWKVTVGADNAQSTP